jgi:hypothetical protein
MDFSPERMNESVRAMKNYYPAFSVGGRPIGTGAEAVWQGWIQPVCSLEDLELLLADLAQNRPVRVLPGGELIHHPQCLRKHQQIPQLENLRKPDQAFKIKITYGGGSRHPRAFVIDPAIPPKERKHKFADGAICSYPPWQDVWNWQTHTVAEFADQAAIWLVKWNVWQQTGIWLGDEMRHEPAFLFLNIKSEEQCWCASGQQYAECHRKSDADKAFRNFLPVNRGSKFDF